MISTRLMTTFGAGLLLTSAAQAVDLSHADCANPAFQASIASHLGHGKLTGTDRLSPNRFNFGPIVSASTVAKSAASISCAVVVSVDGRSGTRQIRGRFTVMQSGSWKWQPGY